MSEEDKCIKAFERYVCDHREKYTTMQADDPLRFLAHEYQYFRAAWNLRQQAPDVERTIRDVCESYRGGKWGKAAEAIGDNIIEMLAAAPKPEDVK